MTDTKTYNETQMKYTLSVFGHLEHISNSNITAAAATTATQLTEKKICSNNNVRIPNVQEHAQTQMERILV